MKTVEIAIPLYYGNINELESQTKVLVDFLRKHMDNYNCRVMLSVNGSNHEEILDLAKKLSKEYKEVSWMYTNQAGKGVGVVEAWLKSNADVMAYMDIDLTTELDAFPELVNAVASGQYDTAVGSRYHPLSFTQRSFKRYLLSQVYHKVFINFILGCRLRDVQCGFKAINQRISKEVLPLVKDRYWFFEAEMLYIAEKLGMKICEIPVRWREGEKSSVNLFKAVPYFFRKIFELRSRKL